MCFDGKIQTYLHFLLEKCAKMMYVALTSEKADWAQGVCLLNLVANSGL